MIDEAAAGEHSEAGPAPAASRDAGGSRGAGAPEARRPAALALLVIALLASALVFHRLHVQRPQLHGFEAFDVEHYFHPTFTFLRDAILRGEWATWNPYQLAGQPFLALHASGPLYPVHLLLLSLWEAPEALQLQFITHLCVAAWFTWLFARRIGVSASGASAAALAFALSGPALYWLYMPPYAATEAWLPAVLWALHRLLTRPSPSAALALSAFLALAFLGGYAQGFVYLVQIGAAYGCFGLVWLAPAGGRLRAIGWAACAGGLALGLVAPQALASVAQARDSVRGLGGLPIDVALANGTFSPARLARGWIGLPKRPDDVATGPLAWLVSLPVLALPLIALGARAREQRAHWIAFALSFAATGLFMLGDRTPLFRLYFALPTGDWFRGPIRIAPAYVWSAALLIGIGVSSLGPVAARLGRLAPVALPALVALIGLDAYRHSALVSTHPVLSQPGRGPRALVERLRNLDEPTRVFVAQPEELHAPPTLVSKLGTLAGVYAVPDYEPNMPADYMRYFGRSDDEMWRGHIGVLEYARTQPADELARLLDLMSVGVYAAVGAQSPRYLEALRQFTGDAGSLRDGVHWFERPAALPRAYAVRRVRTAPDVASALRAMLDPGFRPREEAIAVGAADPLPSAPPGGGSAEDRVWIRSLDLDRVVIDASCGAPCLVVLTDLHYPGWQARVDGERVPLLRVNGIFRGVALPEGSHRIVHEFRPVALRVGGGVAVVAGGAWLALAAWAWRGRRAAR